MLFSQIIPIPLLLHLITPRARISAIYCRAHLPACCEPATRGFRIRNVEGDAVTLENVATGSFLQTDRSDIYGIRVFVTWEI